MAIDPERNDPIGSDPERNDLLAMIKEGMTVVDVDGDRVGTVSFVHMADLNDPDDNPGQRDAGLLGALDDVFDPDEDGDVTARMLREGYVKIDATGIFSDDKYIEPHEIAGVEGDTVQLRLDKDSIGHPA